MDLLLNLGFWKICDFWLQKKDLMSKLWVFAKFEILTKKKEKVAIFYNFQVYNRLVIFFYTYIFN